MENIVQCKRCNKDFNYTPGIAGNARQLCKECRDIVDDEELKKFEEDMIIEKNKYLVGAPGRKNKYDPSVIILNAEFPVLESDADKFICAVEVGMFIRNNGFCNCEKNIGEFLMHLDSAVHRVVCVRQWTTEQMYRFTRTEIAEEYVRKITRSLI